MTSTAQNKKVPKNADEDFSKLLRSSSIPIGPIKSNLAFDRITQAHGALVKDQNNNIYFDLSMNPDKPLWGHSHPLSLRFNRMIKSLDIFDQDKLDELDKSHDEFDKLTFKYIQTVLINGGRLKAIQDSLRNFSNEKDGVNLSGLNLSIELKDNNKIIETFGSQCLYVTNSNFTGSKLQLNFQTSFTNAQLKLCLEKLDKAIGELRCS